MRRAMRDATGGVLAALLALAWPASSADAAGCGGVAFDGVDFTVCTVDLAQEDLRLWLRDSDGAVWGEFARLDEALRDEGRALGVAMNGGMYHPDRAPVGHYVEDGNEEMRVITTAGPGNFGMLPNGVLCIADDEVQIIESRAFASDPPACRYATQSGPLLVADGALHPRFIPDSESRRLRNGVGVSRDGRTVALAISDEPVSFDHFARLFRDALDMPDALYLDGSVSRLWAPGIGRRDPGRTMGPILGTVVRGG